jgi:hypothetical protein
MKHPGLKETEDAPETSACRTSRSHRCAGCENRGRGQGRHTRPLTGRENRSRGRCRHTRTAGSPPPNLVPDRSSGDAGTRRRPGCRQSAASPEVAARGRPTAPGNAMSQRAGTTGRSDSNRPHRSVHRPGPMALVWITVARGVMAIGRRAGPQVETAASRRMEQSAGTLADGRLAAGLDDRQARRAHRIALLLCSRHAHLAGMGGFIGLRGRRGAACPHWTRRESGASTTRSRRSAPAMH